jgi:hypothetical protein
VHDESFLSRDSNLLVHKKEQLQAMMSTYGLKVILRRMASKPLRHAEQRRVHILDTDERTYAEQDSEAFVRTLEHLTMHQQDQLLEAIQTCPILFSGGLGTADVELVDFELVPDAKPYHIKQPFSIPVVYQGTTMKEID